MKVAILGFGSQGQSAFYYWNTPDNQLTICDSRHDLNLPDGVDHKLGSDFLKGLDEFDLIVRGAPIIHPREITEANPEAPHILEKVTSATNEFFRVSPSKNIIGVTGTKGKGTTSSLITKLLEAAGKTVHLGGNIGVPPLDMLKANIQPNDWVVLELANFQLIDLKHSPKIATCLMVVPEHLDWHTDMDEYISAKQQLFVHQTVHDLAIFNRNNAHSQTVVSVSAATKLSYEVPAPGADPTQTTGAYLQADSIFMDDTFICKASDVALLGRHNLENICAAIATVWELIDHQADIVQQVVRDFKGLPHRLELVREVNTLRFYNDSFASAAGATIAAINAIPGKKVMIVGGYERNLPLEDLAQAFAAHDNDIRKTLIIGESAQRLAKAFEAASYENYEILPTMTMPDIVRKAQSVSQSTDAVVLSPGFASFDMFKNFEDRGQQFQAAVREL